MEFDVLGPLRVTHEGAPLALGGPQQQTILCVLLVHAEAVVSADRLIDEVWGEEAPDSARRTLQSSVARLRKVLNVDAELLRGRSPGYILNVAADAVDSRRFAAIVEAAGTMRSEDPTTASEMLRRALGMWHGRPFDGLSDTAPSLYAEAVRLEELRLTAIEQRIDCDLSAGGHRELVAELEYLTTEHALRERFWCQLMTALYRCGRQADALRSYQKARHVLAGELGIEPGPELQQLEQAILLQEAPLAADGDPGAATDVSGPPHAGQTIRGYELRELVETRAGESTYRAYQPALGREVAIAAIDPAVANLPEFIRTFDEAVRRIARLEHPHIVPVYDFWRGPGGAFVVSRWVRGMTLRTEIGRGPLLWETALVAIGQIADALRSAHRKGVAHACLTSADVILDEEGNTHVTGFQHALAACGETLPGPQFAGVGSDARREDVKALGVLLLETLTGALRPDGTADRTAWTLQQLACLPVGVPVAVETLIRRSVHDVETAFETPDELLGAVAAASPGRAPLTVVPEGPVENPYKGLQPFGEADAPDFFGRDALIDELVAAMVDRPGRRFVAVIGPSGCGKSSVVRAGLIPAVRTGAIPGSECWFVTTMVPGRYPFEELAAALMRVAVDPEPILLEELVADRTGLRSAVEGILGVGDGELLLVIDQMEELFTVTDDATRIRFIDSLVDAVVDPGSRLRVVVTLRADFYDRPLHHHELGRLFNDGLITVVPLTARELQHAITGPAKRVGVTVDPDLVGRMIGDVADRPGTLPLLQYVLTELFERRHEDRLAIDGYQSVGGIAAALGRSAEDTYAALTDPARRASRRLFLRLVTIEESGRATKSRVGRRSLTTMSSGAAMETAIEAFAAARLLAVGADPVSGLPTVEVAHEAIFAAWPRLAEWIDTARASLHTERRLNAAVSDWVEHDRDVDYLATGRRLGEFESLDADREFALIPVEQEYVAASRSRRDAAHRSRVRRRRAVTATLLVAFIVAGIFAVVAAQQRRNAEGAARVAFARELAAESVAARDVDAELSVLLALEAVDATAAADGTVLIEAEEALHLAVQSERLIHTIPGATVGAYGPDGATYLAGDEFGAVRVWDLSTGAVHELPEPHGGPVLSLAFGPSGDTVVSGSEDLTAKVWNTQTGAVRTLGKRPSFVVDVAIDRGGRLVATTGDDETARVWDLTADGNTEVLIETTASAVAFDPTGERLAVAKTLPIEIRFIDLPTGDAVASLPTGSIITDLAFAADGSRIAGVGNDGTVTVWDVATGTTVRTYTVSSRTVALSDRGLTLAAGGDDGVVRIWDTRSGREVMTLAGHRGWVTSVSFEPHGTGLATTGVDGSARIWDVSPGRSREVATLIEFTDPAHIGFGGASRYLAAAGSDGDGPKAVIWDTDGWTVKREVAGASRVAVSPDGSAFATVGGNGVATLWDMESGEPLFDLSRNEAAGVADVVTALAFTPNGELVVTGDAVGSVRVWTATSGRLVETMAGSHLGAVERVEVDAGGKSVLSFAGERRDTARVWDIASAREISAPAPAGFVTAAALSSDGSVALTGGPDGVTRAWSTATGAALDAPILAGSGTVRDIAASPDGSRIATAGDDGSVRLWDARTGSLLMRWPAHGDGGTDVVFSSDGRFLASSGNDGTIHVYAAHVDDLVDLARSRLTRALRDDECRRYLHLDACPGDA